MCCCDSKGTSQTCRSSQDRDMWYRLEQLPAAAADTDNTVRSCKSPVFPPFLCLCIKRFIKRKTVVKSFNAFVLVSLWLCALQLNWSKYHCKQMIWCSDPVLFQWKNKCANKQLRSRPVNDKSTKKNPKWFIALKISLVSSTKYVINVIRQRV